MRFLILGGGLVLIATIGAAWWMLSAGSRVTRAMQEMSAVIGSTPHPETEGWLVPQLTRRDRWAGVGLTLGALPSVMFHDERLSDMPRYWFALAFGMGVGVLIGTFAAAFRNFHRKLGTVRAARTNPRKVADYLAAAELRAQYQALGVSVGSCVLAIGLLAHGRHDLGMTTLVVGALATLLGCSALGLQALLVRRPMVTPNERELIWRETLLAWTLRSMSGRAELVGWVAGLVGLVAVTEARSDLPLWLQVASGLYLLACVWVGVDYARSPTDAASAPYLQHAQDVEA